MIVLLCGSYRSTAQANKDSIICLPSSVLRKAAIDIQNGETCDLLLRNRDWEIFLDNKQMAYMDSVIDKQEKIIKQDSAIRNSYINLLNVANGRTQEYKERFFVIKRNDRIKMGVGFTVIVGLCYAWITKK